MPARKLGLRRVREEVLEQASALLRCHAGEVSGDRFAHVKRLATGVRVHANDRMRDGRTFLPPRRNFFRIQISRQVAEALTEIVDRLETVKHRSQPG
jgi:hypothetical protein